MMDRVERSPHHAEPMAGVRVDVGTARQSGGASWRQTRHLFGRRLAVGTALADRQGNQQQRQQEEESEHPKGPVGYRQVTALFGLEQRQSQRHDGSLAAGALARLPRHWDELRRRKCPASTVSGGPAPNRSRRTWLMSSRATPSGL